MSKTPALTRRPRSSIAMDQSDALERLNKVDTWTEEAETRGGRHASLEAPVEAPVEVSTAPLDLVVNEVVHATIPEAPKPSKARKKVEPMPWDDANPRIEKKVLLRIPEPLHAKLKYLGETTYGDSMNKIILKALETEVEKRLAERDGK